MRSRPAPPRRALADLGFEPGELVLVNKILGAPHGLVLVAGRRASGKTTIAQAACAEVSAIHIDPIETAGDAANAVELAKEQLVFATLTATSGTGALACMNELGIGLQTISNVLSGAIFVSRAKRLCAYCTHRYDPPAPELELVGSNSIPPGACFARGVGCAYCNGTGRAGHVPALEVLYRPLGGVAERSSLARSALVKLLAGVISTEEAIAIVDGTR